MVRLTLSLQFEARSLLGRLLLQREAGLAFARG
jgi:hypothetical protein